MKKINENQKRLLNEIIQALVPLSLPQQIHIMGFIEGIRKAKEIENARDRPA